MQKQQKFDFEKTHWKYRFSHGGVLRNSRKGRSFRPLSGREPLHLVMKVNKERVRGGLRNHQRYSLIHKIVDRYSHKFFVKIEQISLQNDHIHLLIRCCRRTQYQNFFRVVCGQIAQQFQKQGLLSFNRNSREETSVTDTLLKLWKYRPFSRVIRGWKAYQIVRDYVQLNEMEALGSIPYRKQRLRGLLTNEWEALWA